MGKVVVLGIDALNKTLLEAPGMEKLRAVFESNTSGILRSVHPPTTDAAWTSFQTGVTPDEHGICGFVDFTSLEQPLYTRKDIKFPTFYDLIEKTGRKQMLFNLPFTYPPTIAGDIVYSWVDYGYPENMPYTPKDLHKRFPSLSNIEMFPERKSTRLENLIKMKEYFVGRSKLIREIIDAEEHDFYFFLISITDWIQHIAYEDISAKKDSEEYRISNEILEDVSDLCMHVINKLNPKEDSVILMSDHGFGKWDRVFNVNTWLQKEGYLKTSKEGKTMSNVLRRRLNKKGKRELRLGRFGDWLREHKSLRKHLSFLERFVKGSGVNLTTERKIDFENSQAVCFSKLSSSIFVNEDMVKSKDKTIADIIKKLNRLDSISATRMEKVYDGKLSNRIGDILVKYEHGFVSNRLDSKVFGDKIVTSHDYNGVYCFIGKKFSANGKTLNIDDMFYLILKLNGFSNN